MNGVDWGKSGSLATGRPPLVTPHRPSPSLLALLLSSVFTCSIASGQKVEPRFHKSFASLRFLYFVVFVRQVIIP